MESMLKQRDINIQNNMDKNIDLMKKIEHAEKLLHLHELDLRIIKDSQLEKKGIESQLNKLKIHHWVKYKKI